MPKKYISDFHEILLNKLMVSDRLENLKEVAYFYPRVRLACYFYQWCMDKIRDITKKK